MMGVLKVTSCEIDSSIIIAFKGLLDLFTFRHNTKPGKFRARARARVSHTVIGDIWTLTLL